MLMNNVSSTHTTQRLTKPVRATLDTLPRLPTSFVPVLQSTSDDSQDNGVGRHDRQALDAQQYPDRLSVASDKNKKLANPARGPNPKPLDTNVMPDGWAVISPKRKARLQSHNRKTVASVGIFHDHRDFGGWFLQTVRIPTATAHFTGGELSYNDARLSCVLPQDFPYRLAKIHKPIEKEGMLKFDVTWKSVFVSFAQIRGEAAAVANLAAILPTFAMFELEDDTTQ
ncbi:hypothetical protein PG984_012857 [Apiospora sp. TS-2023a]